MELSNNERSFDFEFKVWSKTNPLAHARKWTHKEHSNTKSDHYKQYTPGDLASISAENWEISVPGLATSVDKHKEEKMAHMGSKRPRSFFMLIRFVSLLPFFSVFNS